MPYCDIKISEIKNYQTSVRIIGYMSIITSHYYYNLVYCLDNNLVRSSYYARSEYSLFFLLCSPLFPPRSSGQQKHTWQVYVW